MIRRDWTDARAKLEAEGECRISLCVSGERLECAHVVGRFRDPEVSPGRRRVLPDAIVPLCRTHHGEYDAHRLDLLPYLTLEEQLQAVRDAGGLEAARRRLIGSRDGSRDGRPPECVAVSPLHL